MSSNHATIYEQKKMWIAVREKMVMDNLTYSASAKEMGIGLSSLWRLRDEAIPSLINYFKVIQWLGVGPYEFVTNRIIEPYKLKE